MLAPMLCVLLAANPAGGPTREATSASSLTPAVRETVARALPYIVERGQWWIDEKKCGTCHRVGMMIWSLNEAARRGFEVDRERLHATTIWAVDDLLKKDDKGKSKAPGDLQEVSQLLIGAPRDFVTPTLRDALVAEVVAGQQGDGRWKGTGQLPQQKRPQAETDFAATALSMLALAEQAPTEKSTSAEKLAATIDKGRRNMEQSAATEWQSTEAWAMLAAVAAERKDTATLDRCRTELLKTQRPDGGWGWLSVDESDALGTGLALYGLSRCGLDAARPEIAAATKFLSSTQRADGSWSVKGTKKAKQDSEQETACYWGTTWAVVGLLSVHR